MPDASTLRDMNVPVSEQKRSSRMLAATSSAAPEPEEIATFSGEEALFSTKNDNTYSDDVSTLSFITRMRLATVLDPGAKWENLAKHLECGHMIEFLQVRNGKRGKKNHRHGGGGIAPLKLKFSFASYLS